MFGNFAKLWLSNMGRHQEPPLLNGGWSPIGRRLAVFTNGFAQPPDPITILTLGCNYAISQLFQRRNRWVCCLAQATLLFKINVGGLVHPRILPIDHSPLQALEQNPVLPQQPQAIPESLAVHPSTLTPSFPQHPHPPA